MPGSQRLWTLLSALVTSNTLATSSSPVFTQIHVWAVIIAGVFILAAVVLSTFLIFEHLSWYNNPEEQKFLLGVIMIVPLYATESFLSLCSAEFALEWEIARDCYEAFALYAFWRYLNACLGGDERTVESMERAAIAGPRTPLLDHSLGKGAVKHLFPLNYCMKPWSLGQEFFQSVKFGIVQYMMLKTVCALLALALEQMNAYGEGQFQWNKGYAYIAIVLNFSQSWALYCLIQFYTVTQEDLAPIKPLAKFLCFKSIVFLTWWQGLVIDVIFSMGTLKKFDYVKSSLQDFLICVEMGFAAVSHIYVFPAKPYQMMGHQKRGNVSVLSDYASVGSPPDPEEIKDMQRPTIIRFQQNEEPDAGTSLSESMQDVVFKGGEYIVKDVKFTVGKVRAPVQKGFSRLNETFHHLKNMRKKESRDDSCLYEVSSSHGSVKGIDDLFLTGSLSDSGVSSKLKTPFPLLGEGLSDFTAAGSRWTVKE